MIAGGQETIAGDQRTVAGVQEIAAGASAAVDESCFCPHDSRKCELAVIFLPLLHGFRFQLMAGVFLDDRGETVCRVAGGINFCAALVHSLTPGNGVRLRLNKMTAPAGGS
jgi:hypothetical protein